MSLVMVLDCGATNVRAIAVDDKGQVVASHRLANVTHPDPDNSQYQIWDVEAIWKKLALCCQNVTAKLGNRSVDGLAVTTFGVDGAPFDHQGNQLYPVISWKCPRTQPIMDKLDEYLGGDIYSQTFYQENGVGGYSFNTLFKLLWLKENEPSLYRRMGKFLFISSIFNQRLTGRQTTDLTMAGTSMMTVLSSQRWHNSALGLLGLSQDHFPDIVAPGDVIGQLKPSAARELGLKAGITVVSAGHDTQFALFGSGASLNQPVLSSGTWEILMARVNQVNLKPEHRDLGITTEWDAQPSLYNPGVQWLGSGALEWLTNLLFPELKDSPVRYEKMIDEALHSCAGAGGVRFAAPLSLGRDGHSGMLSGMSTQPLAGRSIGPLWSRWHCKHAVG